MNSRRDPTTYLLMARQLARTADDGKPLLLPATFGIDVGDLLVCRGPSGSGKSVLLRALAMLDPSSGQVLCRGKQPRSHEIPRFRARVMYVPQSATFSDTNVEQALQEPFDWKSHQLRKYDRAAALGILEALGRDSSMLTARTADLSGGESQIVAITRALLLDPDVLLLDEPTSALDRDTEHRFENLMQDWVGQGERAIVWVTHRADQAERIATRFMSVDEGKVVIDA